jgi:cell division transport system permease protein
VQVRPAGGRNLDADVAAAAEVVRRAPGIGEVRALSKAESERLLEPWLGSGLDLSDLPIPRLVMVTLAPGAAPDLSTLRQDLSHAVPGASLDDHGLWRSRLSAMANTVIGLGLFAVSLVLVAAGLAVAFATRGAMAGNREVVDVLHLVGADHAFIAREFQLRFFRLGLRGGLIGGLAALALMALLGSAARAWRASPAGDQIEALFGAFDIGWRSYASSLLIAMIVSVVTGIVSRVTVRHYLAGTP